MAKKLSTSALALPAKRNVYRWIAFPAALVIGLLIYSLFIGSSIARRHAPLADAAMEIRLEAALGHVWFEEVITGDPREGIATAWEHLDRSAWFARAMLDGGEHQMGIIVPLRDPVLRREIEEIEDRIARFRAIAEERWAARETSGIGSAIDQRFDEVFAELLAEAGDVESALCAIMAKDRQRFHAVASSLVVICALLALLIGIALQRYERRQSLDMLELRQSKENLSITLDSIGDGVITTDADGRITRMNPVAEVLTDWADAEARGKPLEKIFHIINAMTRAKMENPVEKVLRDGAVVGLANHTTLIARGGAERQIADSGAPIRGADGVINGVVLVFRDVTTSYAKDRQLHESEERFRAMAEDMPALICRFLPDGELTYANEAYCRYFEKVPEELIGTSFLSPIHEADREAVMRDISAQTIESPNRSHVHRVIAPGGNTRWQRWTGRTLFDAQGLVIAHQAIGEDITDRIQTQEALKKSELLLNATGRMAKVGGWEVDAKTLEVSWTEQVHRIHEVPLDYKPPLEDAISFHHPDDRPRVAAAVQKALDHGEPYDLETRFITAKGNYLWTHAICKPVMEDGEVVKLTGTFQDITARKQAEEATTRFNSVLEASLNEIYIFDAESLQFVEVNLGARLNLGYSIEELRAFTPLDLKPEFTSASFAEMIEKLRTGAQETIQFRTVHRRKDSSLYPVEVHLQLMSSAEPVFLAVVIDITERQRAENDLKQRTHDLGERLKELNCLYVISKLTQQPNTTIDHILQGTVDAIPSSWQYPDVTTARITMEDQVYSTANFRESSWRQAAEIVLHGEPVGRVEVYYLADQPACDEGPFLKEERSLINTIAEQLGKTVERIRLQVEAVNLKEQLHQAQKMEAVAQLAGGVAHDFNNLLMVIGGYVSLATNALPKDHEAVASLQGVQEAADQAAGVTRSLLTFSQRTESCKEAVDMRACIETSLRLLRRVLPAGIEVMEDTGGEPAWVMADGTQLQQILMNLAINARDAMPNGGTLTVEVSLTARTSDVPARSAAPSGSVVRLIISDTGTGMSPDVRARIFEPFFTTKPKGQGTGLGLAIIHTIVEDHQGHIYVKSEPGRGTTFTVELPLLEIEAGKIAPPTATPPRRGQGAVVLLAEDNDHVRSFLTSSLESLDYEVIQASDGSALMDCYERYHERIQLLVIDVDLPKRNGLDCLRDLRGGGGVEPAIVMTGSAHADAELRLDDNTFLLRKPFLIADLTALTGRILAAELGHEETR